MRYNLRVMPTRLFESQEIADKVTLFFPCDSMSEVCGLLTSLSLVNSNISCYSIEVVEE